MEPAHFTEVGSDAPKQYGAAAAGGVPDILTLGHNTFPSLCTSTIHPQHRLCPSQGQSWPSARDLEGSHPGLYPRGSISLQPVVSSLSTCCQCTQGSIFLLTQGSLSSHFLPMAIPL